jgi:hypothetical protein
MTAEKEAVLDPKNGHTQLSQIHWRQDHPRGKVQQ